MSTDPSKDRFQFQYLLISARDHLKLVDTSPPIECGEDSLAQLAFDPYIGRRLQTATPIRIVTPPSFEDTCKFVGHFFDGLQEVGLLETVDVLGTWQVRFDRLVGVHINPLLLLVYRLRVICDNGYPTLLCAYLTLGPSHRYIRSFYKVEMFFIDTFSVHILRWFFGVEQISVWLDGESLLLRKYRY